jgi:hypothetical protein
LNPTPGGPIIAYMFGTLTSDWTIFNPQAQLVGGFIFASIVLIAGYFVLKVYFGIF